MILKGEGAYASSVTLVPTPMLHIQFLISHISINPERKSNKESPGAILVKLTSKQQFNEWKIKVHSYVAGKI